MLTKITLTLAAKSGAAQARRPPSTVSRYKVPKVIDSGGPSPGNDVGIMTPLERVECNRKLARRLKAHPGSLDSWRGG